ncbi:MAG: hypothetical protein Q7S02_04440 [bacterium]|nr:hypothetical protein [bacterium]
MHSRTWAIGVAVASVFAVASGSVLAYDVYSPYDPYSGSYTPTFDTNNSAWQPTVPSTNSSGTSGTSGSGSGTSTSTTSSIPAGAVQVTVWGTYGNLVNLKAGGQEKRVSGDWASMKIYVRNIATDRPDLTKPAIGVLLNKKEGSSYIYGDGYFFSDQLAAALGEPIPAPATTATTTTTTTTPSTNTIVTSPATTTTPTTTTTTPTTASQTTTTSSYAASTPPDTTPIVVRDGKVYESATNTLVAHARYDATAKKIYYGDTDSTFGGLLSATTGWVNIKPSAVAPSYPASSPTSDSSYATSPTAVPYVPIALGEIRIPTDAASIGVTPDAAKENAALPLVQKVLGLAREEEIEGSLHGAIITYVAYGHTPETKNIGSGERASTVERFRVLYGAIPKTEQDYRALQAMVIESGLDIVVVKRAIEAERKGLGAFRRIFKHLPATTVTDQELKDAEWKALRIITYGLKPLRRDLVSEQRVIKAFTARFGKPKAVEDWDAIRACVYGSPHTCPLLAR